MSEEWKMSEQMKEILPVMFPKESVKQFEELARQSPEPTPAEQWSRHIADGLQRLIDARLFIMPGEGVEVAIRDNMIGQTNEQSGDLMDLFPQDGKYDVFARFKKEE